MPGPKRSRAPIPLRDAVWLALCASFIVAGRALLRLNLHLPGHNEIPTLFFLVLARGCVPRTGSTTLVGIIAGIAGSALGVGKGGPAGIVRFLVPALVVDVAGMIRPRFPEKVLSAATVGAIAGACRALVGFAGELMIGVSFEVIAARALPNALLHGAFGALGAALAVPVLRRLRAHGIVDGPEVQV